jgi:uncharacterized small protein (DUF1192 family)
MCSQPATYAILRLRNAEKSIAELTNKLGMLEKENATSSTRLQDATQEVSELKQRLALVLKQRSEVERLTALLGLWKQQQELEEAEADPDVEQESSVHGNFESALPPSRTNAGDSSARSSLPTTVPLLNMNSHERSVDLDKHPVGPPIHSAGQTTTLCHRQESRSLAGVTSLPQPATPLRGTTIPTTASARSDITPRSSSSSQAARAALASLSPELLSRMTTRPSEYSPQLVAGALDSSSYNAGKAWFQRTELDA